MSSFSLLSRRRAKPGFLSASLHTRILLLVLLPLLVLATLASAISTFQRQSESQAALEDQRALLIQLRQQGVSDVAQMAATAIAHILADTRLDRDEKRNRSREILRNLRFEGGNYVFVVDYDGITQAQPAAPQLEGKNTLELRDDQGRYFIRDMLDLARKGGGHYEYEWLNPDTQSVETKYSYAVGIPELEWMIGAGVYATAIDAVMSEAHAVAHDKLIAGLLRSVLVSLALLAGIALIAAYASRRMVGRILAMADTLAGITGEVAQGRGDLSQRVPVVGRDEIALMATHVNDFMEKMQRILLEVRNSAVSVDRASEDLSRLGDSLAERSAQSAANLEETSAAMEQITVTVQQSADMAEQANQLTLAASQSTQEGHASMQNVQQTMADIRDASRRIGEIVSTIDGIAFQTNILALNASVEAARAGVHGRGFAIVAQEVRSLAQHSADAAHEIRNLIDESETRIRSGEDVVQTTATLMHDIVEQIRQITVSVDEITTAAREQSQGITQVNQAVSEMDQMTQKNAAMVQDATRSAEDLHGHAGRLTRLLAGFTLDQPATLPREAPAA